MFTLRPCIHAFPEFLKDGSWTCDKERSAVYCAVHTLLVGLLVCHETDARRVPHPDATGGQFSGKTAYLEAHSLHLRKVGKEREGEREGEDREGERRDSGIYNWLMCE